jgi:anti-anti-sigma factor
MDGADSVSQVDLTITTSEIGSIAVLSLAGEVDLATVPKLRDSLARLLNERPGRTVAVDLDGLVALDDLGLGVLLGAAGLARDRGGDIVVVCSDERTLRRTASTGLDRAMRVVPSVAAAAAG